MARMPYKLGLDERPINEGDKMVDLMHGKVLGDEFEYFGEVIPLSYISKSKTRFVFDTSGGGVVVTNEKGEGCSSVEFNLKVHDPRPWMKDLHHASLFLGRWIACDENGEWFFYTVNPHIENANSKAFSTHNGEGILRILGVKMPKLTGDQWRDSKISIKDLATYQTNSGS